MDQKHEAQKPPTLEKHSDKPGTAPDEQIDEQIDESFPASDPPSYNAVVGVGRPDHEKEEAGTAKREK